MVKGSVRIMAAAKQNTVNYEDILRDVRARKLKPIYYLMGEESYYIDRISDYIVDTVLKEDEKGDKRVVLRLHPALAPFKSAVLPLSKKLSDKAMEIKNELSKYFMIDFDEAGSIGKRYRREDEIGTPLCITYDFDSETDGCVTVRDRDTMEQVRIPISELKDYIEKTVEF